MSSQEVRVIHTSPMLGRNAKTGEVVVEGWAARFNEPSLPLGFMRYIETIDKGAFSRALETTQARALWNHDTNSIPLARYPGTLHLEERDEGLWYRFTPPRTGKGPELVEALERRDVQESSFAFRTDFEDEEKVSWTVTPAGQWRAQIHVIDDLFDVSPVVYPAYPSATAGVAEAARSVIEQRMKLKTERHRASTLRLRLQLEEMR